MSRGSQSTTVVRTGSSSAVYGLGLIGALVFYWQQADGLWPHLFALVQAVLWPAFLVYDVLGFIGG